MPYLANQNIVASSERLWKGTDKAERPEMHGVWCAKWNVCIWEQQHFLSRSPKWCVTYNNEWFCNNVWEKGKKKMPDKVPLSNVRKNSNKNCLKKGSEYKKKKRRGENYLQKLSFLLYSPPLWGEAIVIHTYTFLNTFSFITQHTHKTLPHCFQHPLSLNFPLLQDMRGGREKLKHHS